MGSRNRCPPAGRRGHGHVRSQPDGDVPRARVPQGPLQAGEQRDSRIRPRRGGDARAGARPPDGPQAARRAPEGRGVRGSRRPEEARARSRRAGRDDGGIVVESVRARSPVVGRHPDARNDAVRRARRVSYFRRVRTARGCVRALPDERRGPDSRRSEGASRERDARELRGRHAGGRHPARAPQEPAASRAHRAARSRDGLRAVPRRYWTQGHGTHGKGGPRHVAHVRARRDRARGRHWTDPCRE